MLVPAEWPVPDLVTRVERALELATEAIALVGAQHPSVDLYALEAPPDKVIAETAMLVRAAAAVPASLAPGVSARAHALARELIPHARHPRVAVGLALHPALARDYAAAHLVLTRLGYPDTDFDRALARALAAPTATARERLPHRELEQEWLASLVGESVLFDSALERTALVRGVDLLTGSRDDIYALTHALLYATDFGNHTLPRESVDLLFIVQSAVAGALDDDDFDLAGELLLAWPLLGAAWGPIPSFAFAVLAHVEDEVGLLPSLALDGEAYARQPPESRRGYVTAATYHTGFVMGLLCAAVLRADRRPPTQPPVPLALAPGVAAFADELLNELAANQRRPQWLLRLRALLPLQREACTPLLIDIALRRAVRRLDLAMVQRLLQASVHHGVALSPLCAQAAGLLSRLASCAVLFAHEPDHLTPPEVGDPVVTDRVPMRDSWQRRQGSASER